MDTETEWDSSMALLGVAETDAAQRRLVNLFAQLTAERRERILADLEDHVVLSRREIHRETDEYLEGRIPGVTEP